MADKIIENVKFVEIDRSKKYILLFDSDIDAEDILKIRNSIFEWLDDNNNPMIMLVGNGIRLLEAEKDEQS
jgi:hypothetical protein